MGLSLSEIQRRRGELVERARNQRATVQTIFNSQRNTLWLADRAIALGRLIAARKGLVLVAALGFALVQPRRALRLAFHAWNLFRLFRKIRRALA